MIRRPASPHDRRRRGVSGLARLLLGARIAAVFSKPINVPRAQDLDEPFLESMKERLNFVTNRAQEIIKKEK